MMYKKIDAHPGSRTLYAKHLMDQGIVTQSDVDTLWESFRDDLDAGKQVAETLTTVCRITINQ